MKKALLISLSLLSLATPFTLDATSDEEIGMEEVAISEVTEEQSTSSSSEESELEQHKAQELPKIKRKPAWKKWLGYGFTTLIAIGLYSDGANGLFGLAATQTTIALPYTNALPPNGEHCTYFYSPHCNNVINEELCNEYLDQFTENKIIKGRCVVDERDEYQLSLGAVSYATRLVTSCFTQRGIDKMFFNNN